MNWLVDFLVQKLISYISLFEISCIISLGTAGKWSFVKHDELLTGGSIGKGQSHVERTCSHIRQTDSLVEWLTLPSLSQTAALLFFFERSVRPPRPPRSIVPWWGYGNAQRLRCFSQREQVGDPQGRRFTLCSCETITIMGYRAERSWGNARWAIGPR